MHEVAVAGLSVVSALGRGPEAQLAAALPGASAFTAVGRFDTSGRRVTVAATARVVEALPIELVVAVATACADAGLARAERAATPLVLAVHGDERVGALARSVASQAGVAAPLRVYTSACVSASTAIADAAALIRGGMVERIVVAAGYLVEPDQFALFDAGRALATDGMVRPFSAGRSGLLLGDGVGAVVLQAGQGVAEIVGWGRAGDAYHPCRPAPDGHGLATAVEAALRRADLPASAVGYVNANATGTSLSDASEAAALLRVIGDGTPVSSTKAVHGHALEASGLLELVITVLALKAGELPVNAGYAGPDPDCPLDLILDSPRPVASPYGLTLNAAFGGANTALLVRAA